MVFNLFSDKETTCFCAEDNIKLTATRVDVCSTLVAAI